MAEYYSALNRGGILLCATSWMNLENIMLREISQPQKNKHPESLVHEPWKSQIPKRQTVEWQLPGAGRVGAGRGSYYLNCTKFQFGMIKKL